LPASFAYMAFITTPICFSDVTPVSAIAAEIAASISSSLAPAGRYPSMSFRSASSLSAY
jgi:hypothetical protein